MKTSVQRMVGTVLGPVTPSIRDFSRKKSKRSKRVRSDVKVDLPEDPVKTDEVVSVLVLRIELPLLHHDEPFN